MLYLPRLFVYHADVAPGSPQSETFKVMERRLLRAIINPAMMVDLGVRTVARLEGLCLSGGWLHAKIAVVLVLSAVHGYLAGAVRHLPRTATKSRRGTGVSSTKSPQC